MENNQLIKTTSIALVKSNVGLTKYANGLITTLNKEELFKEAINLFKEENYHAAYLVFYRIYQNYPVSKGLYPYLAYCAYETNRKDKIEFFLWKDFELKVVDYYSTNRLFLDREQWQHLEKILSRYNTFESKLIRIHVMLILMQYTRAKSNIKKLYEPEPSLLSHQFWYYKLIGDTYHFAEKYLEAIEYLTKAIKVDNKNAIAYANRGIAKGKLENYNGQISDCTKAIQREPSKFQFYVSRGNAKFEMFDYTGAIEDYSKAIRINGQYAISYFNRGQAKSLSNMNGIHKNSIVEDFSTAIVLVTSNPNFNNDRGDLKIKKNWSKVIFEEYSNSIELGYIDMFAYYFRGERSHYFNDLVAIEDYTKAIAIAPNYNSHWYWMRADAKSQIGDYLGAIEDYSKSIELYPNDFTAYCNRGNAYEKIGDIAASQKDHEIEWELYQKYGSHQN